jgi:hypothetical protein
VLRDLGIGKFRQDVVVPAGLGKFDSNAAPVDECNGEYEAADFPEV